MARRRVNKPEVTRRILEALKVGNTRRTAAAYAGLDHATFYRWLEKDSDFCDAVEKAEADAEVWHVTNIRKAAGDGTWTASAWWLERRRHEDWKRREQLDLNSLPTSRLIELAGEVERRIESAGDRAALAAADASE